MKKRYQILVIIVPIAAIVTSMFLGRYPVKPDEIVRLIASKIFPAIDASFSAALETSILNVRIPRIIVAFLSGATLASTGAVFQGVFHNPLVSDHVLGVSNGASFGASIALLLSMPRLVIQFSSFASGIAAVVFAYLLTRVYRNRSALTLILSGIIVSGFFSALVSFLKTIADPLDKMPAITFWLMGSFAKISSGDLIYAVPSMLIPMVILYLIRWRINVLAAGEESAKALGMNTNAFRMLLIALCTFATAASVAVSGVVGWVGLIVPHICRILVGTDYKVLVPMSIALGGTYLLVMDDIARLAASFEVPIGILTALVGAPLFAALLRRGSGWE